MAGKSSHIAYLLDAEGHLAIIEDRLNQAIQRAVERGHIKAADDIARLKEHIIVASESLFAMLATMETPRPRTAKRRRPLIDKTPIGYHWEHLGEDASTCEEEDEDCEEAGNRITVIPED
jgi:hypothetical protein